MPQFEPTGKERNSFAGYGDRQGEIGLLLHNGHKVEYVCNTYIQKVPEGIS